jgi:hypothetical protein
VDPVIAKIPAAARPETMAGAEAFARFYVNQINAAFMAPDRSALSGLGNSSCDTCGVYENTAGDFEAKRQRQKSPLLQVTSITASKFAPGKATVNVFFNQSSVDIVDNDGTRVGRTSAGKGAFVFTLAREQGRWEVSGLKAASS